MSFGSFPAKPKTTRCLIGEPGVGKTAIAEGLALRIVAGDVPENLKEKTHVLSGYGRSGCRRQVPRRV